MWCIRRDYAVWYIDLDQLFFVSDSFPRNIITLRRPLHIAPYQIIFRLLTAFSSQFSLLLTLKNTPEKQSKKSPIPEKNRRCIPKFHFHHQQATSPLFLPPHRTRKHRILGIKKPAILKWRRVIDHSEYFTACIMIGFTNLLRGILMIFMRMLFLAFLSSTFLLSFLWLFL